MVYKLNTNNKDYISIKFWYLEWEKYVQNKNYSSAMKLFENDVVSFGTWMDIVQGLDQLKLNQWKNIWPTISNFKFLTDTIFIQLSPDKLFANSIIIWDSIGYKNDGISFERTGRAVTLKRDNLNSNWKGIHTLKQMFLNNHLTKSSCFLMMIKYYISGHSACLVARPSGGREVVGSNRFGPTIKKLMT